MDGRRGRWSRRSLVFALALAVRAGRPPQLAAHQAELLAVALGSRARVSVPSALTLLALATAFVWRLAGGLIVQRGGDC